MDREALPADTLGVLCDCAACRGPQPAAAAASSSAQPASFGRVFNPNQFASHAGNRSKKWKLAALVPGFTHSVPVWCYLLYFGLVAPDPPRATRLLLTPGAASGSSGANLHASAPLRPAAAFSGFGSRTEEVQKQNQEDEQDDDDVPTAEVLSAGGGGGRGGDSSPLAGMFVPGTPAPALLLLNAPGGGCRQAPPPVNLSAVAAVKSERLPPLIEGAQMMPSEYNRETCVRCRRRGPIVCCSLCKVEITF